MMGTLQLSPNDPPDQNMVNTGGGGGGSVAKNGTFVTSVVSIRNNVNHADKTQNVYWTTVIEQGSGLMARNHYIDEILHLHTDHGARRIAPRRQRPTPTAPGSWTHTYSNNISQGLTGRRSPQT